MALFNLQVLLLSVCLFEAIAFQPARVKYEGAYDAKTGLNRDEETETGDDHHDEILPAKETEDCRDLASSRRCRYEKRQNGCDREKMRLNCQKTCHICHLKAPAPPKNVDCRETTYGCCWDGKSIQYSYDGEGCPECKDNKAFEALCSIWAKHCHDSTNKVYHEVVRQNCHKTCNICSVPKTTERSLKTTPPLEIIDNSNSNSDDVPRRGAVWIWTKFVDFFGFN